MTRPLPWAAVAAAAFGLFLVIGHAETAAAQAIDEALTDPALEARAVAIHKRIRCLVCQNQSIHSSDAELARDLRVIVRERIAAGDTDEKVIQFLVERYGDWVLLRPPLKPATLALWIGPPVILVLGGIIAFAFFRRARRQAGAGQPLSDEEQLEAQKLLAESD